MKTRITLLLFVLAVVMVTAPSFTAPEKASPMAKLMRDMLTYIKKERYRIQEGLKPQPYPTRFEKIKTAQVTAGKKPAKDHEQYITTFMAQLNAYYKYNTWNERKATFNTVINTCITCHEEECPGPIQTIKENRL